MNVAPVPDEPCDVRTSRMLADADSSESALFTVRSLRRLETSSSVNTRSLLDGSRSDETGKIVTQFMHCNKTMNDISRGGNLTRVF